MPEKPYGTSPGICVANVRVGHQRINAFTPTNGELYWSISEVSGADNSTIVQSNGVDIDPEVGYAGPSVNFYDRDNYITGLVSDKIETIEDLYADSEPTTEQGWRTFSAIKPWFLEQGDEYLSPSYPPQPTSGEQSTQPATFVYPSNYTGAKYTYDSDTISQSGAIDTSSFQMISQVQAGKSCGTLQQNIAFYKSQEFKIKLKVYEPTQQNQIWANIVGITGPFLIFEFGMIGTPHFIIVFPYNQPSFMLTLRNNNWVDYESKIATPPDWILKNTENEYMEFHFISMKNRIIIKKLNGSTFTYPDSSITENNPNGTLTSQYIQGMFGEPNGIYLPEVPIRVHHRGLKFRFHTTSSEFTYQGTSFIRNGQQYTINSGPTFIDSPVMLISNDQYIEKLSIDNADVPNYTVMLPNGSYQNQVGIEIDPTIPFLTGSGIPVSQSITLYPMMVPAIFMQALQGNSAYKAIDSIDASLKYMTAYKIRAVFHAVKPYRQNAPSANYFRTKLYSIRTIVRCRYIGIGGGADISNAVKKINYEYTNEGHSFIRKNFTVECLVAKEQSKSILNRTGNNSWEKLERNPAVIKINIGWSTGDRYNAFSKTIDTDPVFLGISKNGTMNFTDKEDTLTLNCQDLFSILEKSVIVNSPYYDGMAAPMAIGTLLDKAGFHALGPTLNPQGWFFVNTRYGNPYQWTLPYSGLFTNPLVKFENGTTYKDAIKQILNRFWLIMFCHNNKFVLSSVPGTVYGLPNDLAVTSKLGFGNPNENFFYSIDPENTGNNIYKIVLQERRTSVDSDQQVNIASVNAVDAYTGNIIGVFRSDMASVINPNADNFLGYMQMWNSQKSALGSKQDTELLLNRIFPYISQPKTEVTFKVWGQDHIYPGDIVAIDNNRIRVTRVSGSVERSAEHWKITVTGEHYGPWNTDIDTSRPNT